MVTSRYSDREALKSDIEQRERELWDLKRELAGLATNEALLPPGEFGVLVCGVGSWRIAFLAGALDEVVPVARLDPIPDAPPWVRGLLNLRGARVPVVDLGVRLEGTSRPVHPDDAILVCSVGNRRVGFQVEHLLGIRRVSREAVEPAPVDSTFSAYVLGVVEIDATCVLVLSTEALLAMSSVPAEWE